MVENFRWLLIDQLQTVRQMTKPTSQASRQKIVTRDDTTAMSHAYDKEN